MAVPLPMDSRSQGRFLKQMIAAMRRKGWVEPPLAF